MSIILMILLLSLLILVHEAGHFFAARAFGIKVDKFGFGLPVGPTLFKKQCGDVEIVVHALLLGGYVSFPDDDKNCELPQDSEERFINKPKWQRAIVVSAGVIANVICAYALVLTVALFTGQLPSGNANVIIEEIDTQNTSKVSNSSLQKGDIILSANDCEINNIYSLVTIAKNSAKFNGMTTLQTVDKNYEALKGLNPGFEKDEIIPAELSIRLPENPVSDIITLDKYTAKGAKYFKHEGIKLDENIQELSKELDGKTVFISKGKYSLYDLAQAISNEKHPVNLKIKRNGKEINIDSIFPNEEGIMGIGLSSEQTFVPTKTLPSALKESNSYLITNTSTMIYSLGQLFTGNIPMKDLHGVVAITKIGGDIIEKSGKASGLLLASLISMNLALLNILPIPALDGGHLMFLLIEKIIGKPLDENIIEKISMVFFGLLIALMIFVIFNDIILLIHK